MNIFFFIICLTCFYLSTLCQTIDCDAVESVGNSYDSIILYKLNDIYEGHTAKVGPAKRKTLVIKGFQSVSFVGCKIQFKIKITIKRPWRRDAHGYATGRADIISYDAKSLCYNNAKVTDIDVSNTSLMEGVYERFANSGSFFPKSGCISFA